MNPLSIPKVNNDRLKYPLLSVRINELFDHNICRFDVPVNKTLGVNVMDSI